MCTIPILAVVPSVFQTKGAAGKGAITESRQVLGSENKMFLWLKSFTVVSLVITKEVALLCYAFDTTVPMLSHSAQVSLSYPIGRFIGSNYIL